MIMDHIEASGLLVRSAGIVGTESIGLEDAFGRILGEDIEALENVPSFDRSPYDGYAFKASDTEGASEDQPVTLSVTENIRAGQMPEHEVARGEAVRLMTGAPVPRGADAICRYEDTEFTESTVTIRKCFRPGENIVRAGENIKKGVKAAEKGCTVDAGLSGTLASLGRLFINVFKRPVAGLITTGDEVVDPHEVPPPGKIRNSNLYSIGAALKKIGLDTVVLGHAPDTAEGIRELILNGERSCDVIISTGGVSVGDYDLVPDAMKECGYEIPVRGVAMKPGMACAYGIKSGRLMLALSGNPASSLTNLQCICGPALKKMAGYASYEHRILRFKLSGDIHKTGGKGTRFIRGRSMIRDGELYLDAAPSQGNVVISSAVSCDAYGILPAGSGPYKGGSCIEGFFI